MSWTSNDPTATAVNVYRWTDADATPVQISTSVFDAGTTPFQDTGLTPDTHCYYKICAIDPTGASGFSVVDAFTLPNAPSGLSASDVSGTEVDLAWTANNGPNVAFEIDRADHGTGDFSEIEITDPGATSYNDTTVEDGMTYDYQISALSEDGGGSTPGTTIGHRIVPLDQPYNLVVTPTTTETDGPGEIWNNREIDLTWSSDSVNATSYLVEGGACPDFRGNRQIGIIDVFPAWKPVFLGDSHGSAFDDG